MRMGALGVVLGIWFLVGCTTPCIIDSDPQDADVYLDNKRIGTTPVTAKLEKGFVSEYEVKVVKQGYDTEVKLLRKEVDAWGKANWPNRLFFRLRRSGTERR